MKCEFNKIRRTNFKPDVNSAYDADREFIVSFVDAYVVEMLLNYFDMETIYSAPNRHQPPVFDSDEDKRTWIFNNIGKVMLYI